MRTLSDYKMMLAQPCWKNPARLCPLPRPKSSFLETVKAELEDSRKPLSCYFNSTVRSPPCLAASACMFVLGMLSPTLAMQSACM